MKKVFIVLIALVFNSYCFGQEISSSVVATAGGSVETDDLSVSWTVGEVAVKTLGEEGVTPILTQGFQQGYFEITSIGDPVSNDFNIKLYPNPAAEFVWVEIESQNIKKGIIEIYNLEGKLVYNRNWEFVDGPQMITINNLGASQYILRVTESSGRILQSFKLIKR
jgi:hypothetical protein